MGRSSRLWGSACAIARVIRFAALGQDLRLLNPLFGIDPARQSQTLIDTVDVGGCPKRHLLKAGDAEILQALLGGFIDGANALKIITAFEAHWDILCCCGLGRSRRRHGPRRLS